MNNLEKFTKAYTEALSYYVQKNPSEYLYPVQEVPTVVAKMVPAYQRGTANLGPAMKRAAKALGLRPSLTAVREYLSAPEPVEAERLPKDVLLPLRETED